MISVVDAAGSHTPATTAFVYVTTEKAALYRAIMRAFIESKERFKFNLSLQETRDFIRTRSPDLLEESEIESALTRLCEWGNLQACDHQHNFQITVQGEAAERALAGFSAASDDEGALHRNGVANFRPVLQELKQLSGLAEPDAGKIHRSLLVLRALFEDLSKTSQNLIARLDQRTGLQSADARRLVDYGQQFIDELVLDADFIRESIGAIEASGPERLRVAAEQVGLDWERFRRWFISQPGFPSSSEMLRERARSSITALLSIIARINDQQTHRIGRSGDFRTLARWFAEAGSDEEAHRLWRAAFGLCPARHFLKDDAIGRRDGGNVRTAGLSRMIDRTAEKEKLAAASREEAQRLVNAQQRFGTGGRVRLSELEHLETGEFELFLELLGEAVSARVLPDEIVEIVSGDGCLRVKLEPTRDGREAMILTTDGSLRWPDHWISIEPVL